MISYEILPYASLLNKVLLYWLIDSHKREYKGMDSLKFEVDNRSKDKVSFIFFPPHILTMDLKEI